MINNGNNGDGGPNQQQQLVQIPAKEYESKFKSKRGAYSNPAVGPLFGDGIVEWVVSPGLNLFRRESSDSFTFLFFLEAYNFLAGECQIYLPPYGKCPCIILP